MEARDLILSSWCIALLTAQNGSLCPDLRDPSLFDVATEYRLKTTHLTVCHRAVFPLLVFLSFFHPVALFFLVGFPSSAMQMK